jgi:hypothetical protein
MLIALIVDCELISNAGTDVLLMASNTQLMSSDPKEQTSWNLA